MNELLDIPKIHIRLQCRFRDDVLFPVFSQHVWLACLLVSGDGSS